MSDKEITKYLKSFTLVQVVGYIDKDCGACGFSCKLPSPGICGNVIENITPEGIFIK